MATATITAADTWTDPVRFGPLESGGLSITGASWVATVSLQRRPYGKTGWDLVPNGQWTAITEKRIAPSGAYEYRLGVASGQYTSGTITVELRGIR